MADAHQVTVHRVSVWRTLRGLALTRGKDLHAVEQTWPEVRQARRVWIARRQPFMANLLPRIGFIDATALKTNMARITGQFSGWARLIDHASLGHWNARSGAPPIQG